VKSQMRYLCLTIDMWTFGPQFDLLVPKVTAASNILCALLPNIGGAGTGVRRLYEGVIPARVLYGAPNMGRGSNGQPSQPDLTAEATQDDRYSHSEEI
jgi:hypothetical protein